MLKLHTIEILKNLCITSNWPLLPEILLHPPSPCIYGSALTGSASCEGCSTVAFTIEKKSIYRWTHAVQIHVFQGSAVYVCICLSQYDYVCKSVWVVLSVSVCMLFSNN